MSPDEEPDGELITEDPMKVREFELALAGHLSRTDRRRFWHALLAAELIVFRA